jgi:gliding motility-associated lipoprotein GldH
MKTIRISRLFICLLLVAYARSFSSCKQIDVYEKNTVIPQYEWKPGFTARGSFLIKDTSSTYNVYLVLRHTDAYQYNNIWLNIGMQPPGDSMNMQKVDIRLGNDASGWEGSGMNDIWEIRKLLTRHYPMKKAGTYNFTISQVMRDDPLRNVMSVGLRIEKQGN